MVADPVEVMGINTRVDLAMANEVLRQEKVKDLMLSGVTVVDPKDNLCGQDGGGGKGYHPLSELSLQGKTRIGERCIIEPNSKISDSVIGNEVTIRSNSVITESKIEDGASIGPFAHLRPLSEVKTKAKIGNFVEVKKSIIGKRFQSQPPHLYRRFDRWRRGQYRGRDHHLQLRWIRETSDDHR